MARSEHAHLMCEWRGLRSAPEGDLEVDRLETLETELLTTPPTSTAHAAAMVEVIRANVVTGGRSDGLDVDALDLLSRFLIGLEVKTSPRIALV